jgi:hypothetical protein
VIIIKPYISGAHLIKESVMFHLLPVVLGVQSIADAGVTTTRVPLPTQPQLIRTGPGQRVEPLRAAAFRIENGRVVLTSNWIDLSGATLRGTFQYAYDCFESDSTEPATLVPWDNDPGCRAGGLPNPGDRWHFTLGFNNPFVSADLVTPFAGTACEGVVHAWDWKVGAAEPDHNGDGQPDAQCFLALSTFETMDTFGCSDDGSTEIDGVIYDFGSLNSAASYYFAAIDLRGSGLFHTMPADGAGGYQVFYFKALLDFPPYVDIPGGINSITQLGVAVQPMLWGTGDAEPVDDGRTGTQDAREFDDVYPPDGVHAVPVECVDYAFGVCPNPLGAMTGFLYAGPPPCCPGDIDGTGIVDIADLGLLLAFFGQSNVSYPCVDQNNDDSVDLADLTILLSAYGTHCP